MKNKKYYILSFIIPLITMIMLYICAGIIGGNKSILTVDLADQYIAFFNALKNIFLGKIDWAYSFGKTLGGNFFGLITYYLMSPLNIIIVLFKQIDIPKAILIINILKIALSGLTSYIYFNKTYKNNNKISLTFSVIYSLMAYNIIYSQNIMWLDGVIMLPLIFLGINKLINGKPRMFYLTLTISIICNYYIGYMSCIASLLYFIYKDYLKEDKIVIKNIINFIKYLLLSVLTCGIILLPSIYSLLSGKASGILQEFIPNQKFAILDIITRFSIGSFKNVDLEKGCPNIYISLIIIVLVIYYFSNKKITTKEKKASALLLSVFGISFIFYPIDVIWHIFKHPYGFPFRYSFIFDFILLIIGYESILKIEAIDKPFIKKFTLYSLIFTLVIDKILYTSTMYYKILLTFIILIVYLIYLSKRKTKTINTLIITIIITEMFINGLLIVTNLKYQDKKVYTNFIEENKPIIDKLNQKESFYRLEKDYSYSTNDELILNYNGISHFSSVYEEKNNELLGKYLGIFNRFYITNHHGSTLATNSLFNIKYLLTKKELNYYKKIGVNDTINIYENNYNLPLGFTVSKNIQNINIEPFNPFVNQNNIFKSMDENIENIFIKEEPTITLNNLKIGDNKIYKKINPNNSASIILELNQNNKGLLYGYISTKKYKKVDIKLNGKSIIDINDQNDYYYNILELGTFNSEDKIILEIEPLEETLQIEDYMFYTLDFEKFNHAIENLRKNDQLILKKYNKGYIEAEITINDANKILYTSIPYDESLVVKVDGKPIKKETTLNTLLALKLEKGSHKITINYTPKGLKMGSLLSTMGIVIFELKNKKNKKTKK